MWLTPSFLAICAVDARFHNLENDLLSADERFDEDPTTVQRSSNVVLADLLCSETSLHFAFFKLECCRSVGEYSFGELFEGSAMRKKSLPLPQLAEISNLCDAV